MSSTISSVVVAAATTSAIKATPQGGVLEHVSPVKVIYLDTFIHVFFGLMVESG